MAILSENLKRRIVHAIADALYGQELIDAIENSIDSQGIQGDAGPKGDKGDTGETGSQGIQGPVGPQGAQGIQGVQGNQGLQGSPFAIAKVYSSVAALQADTSPSGISAGQFAIIDTGNVNDADNARLYLWNGSVYSFIVDMSGAIGLQGPQGAQGIQGVQGPVGSQGPAGASGTVIHKGLYSMNQLNQSVFTVTFPDVGTTNYIVVGTIQELSGSHPRHLTPVVIAKTSNSFTFETNQTTDGSLNYKLQWMLALL